MAETEIARRDLWAKLGNIKKGEEWLKAAEKLDLILTQPRGGTSHHAIRLQGFEFTDVRGCITNVYPKMRKDHNEKVFKAIVKKGGFTEDEVWKALGMLP